jgi:hypothetical protein
MILSKLAAATLVVSVVTSPRIDPAATQHLSIHQKNVAARVYVESATDCIARTVATDARFRKDDPAFNLGDLIVDSMPKCLVPVRDMIAVYDRYFGEGAGEDFFMGPYLDILPNAIVNLIKTRAQ